MHRYLIALAALAIMLGQAVADNFIYVADHNTGRVIKIKMDGTLVWDAPNGNSHDVQVLPNKNVLINHGGVVEEIAPDRKVVTGNIPGPERFLKPVCPGDGVAWIIVVVPGGFCCRSGIICKRLLMDHVPVGGHPHPQGI